VQRLPIERKFSAERRNERRFIRHQSKNKYAALLPAAEARGLTVCKLADRLMDIICAEPPLVDAILDDKKNENINGKAQGSAGLNFAAGRGAAPG
jgi:hypothetical protein